MQYYVPNYIVQIDFVLDFMQDYLPNYIVQIDIFEVKKRPQMMRNYVIDDEQLCQWT